MIKRRNLNENFCIIATAGEDTSKVTLNVYPLMRIPSEILGYCNIALQCDMFKVTKNFNGSLNTDDIEKDIDYNSIDSDNIKVFNYTRSKSSIIYIEHKNTFTLIIKKRDRYSVYTECTLVEDMTHIHCYDANMRRYIDIPVILEYDEF